MTCPVQVCDVGQIREGDLREGREDKSTRRNERDESELKGREGI